MTDKTIEITDGMSGGSTTMYTLREANRWLIDVTDNLPEKLRRGLHRISRIVANPHPTTVEVYGKGEDVPWWRYTMGLGWYNTETRAKNRQSETPYGEKRSPIW